MNRPTCPLHDAALRSALGMGVHRRRIALLSPAASVVQASWGI